MMATRTVAQRLGRLLEIVTRQSGRLPETPEYGSWLLGRVSESQAHRRVRIQLILTVFIVATNLIGIGVALLLLTMAFPSPSIFSDAPLWIAFAVAPAYIAVALALGTFLITRRTVGVLRWAIEEREPTPADERSAFLAPLWLALGVLILWGLGAGLLTTLWGLADTTFIPIVGFSVSFCGILVATGCYLLTEFALRPVAAQALEAGRVPRRLAPGIMGRTLTVWLLAAVLAKLSQSYRANALARGEADPGHGVLESVMIVAAGVAIVVFGVWFLLFAGASPIPRTA